MKTILVTGGAGFIGSNLIEVLLKRKWVGRVVCVDNLDPYYDPAFKKENIKPFLKNEKFKFYKTDIRDFDAMEKIFENEKPTFVVHLAAKANARASVKNPDEYYSVNIHGTLNLLELSRDIRVKKFIFISSSSVYGNTAKSPFSELSTTDFPLAPYGASKKAGEVFAYTYAHNFKIPIVCLRLFNAYGERQRPDLVIYKWVENILKGESIEMSGHGKRARDFTYVGDIVHAIELALKSGKEYEIFNIGNSKPVSLLVLLKHVEKVLGKKAVVITRPSHHASVESTYADIRKAKKVLGWEPEVSLEEGITRFANWLRNNRFKNIV
ncbi:MAG: GDP-mannose 4,6-dehydratase [Candidatus Yonathbacteria bacterium]|nr:GDP-mannose 4,6-dehydratase [Candidatus Yonathbacteria bacterium]